MGAYSKYINEARRPVPTPRHIIDESGNAVFGTFESEFEDLNLLDIKAPHSAKAANVLKLTLWQAAEIHFKEGILLTAVYDMGILGKTIATFYDERSRKVYSWDNTLPHKGVKIARNLLGGSVSRAETAESRVRFENTYEEGKCVIEGAHRGRGREGADIEYNVTLAKMSGSSIVSIPFEHNMPLYSQKSFFKVTGKIILNGEVLTSDEDTVAVVDDHRGYYPNHMHYDWLTALGRNGGGGASEYFAFNLTVNQSIDAERYNENLIWLPERTSILPPVTFTRSVPTSRFSGYAEWLIRDEHDMVNITFRVYALNPMVVHAGLISVDYYAAFGELSGYVRDEDGAKYVLDGMCAMGEDKTMRL